MEDIVSLEEAIDTLNEVGDFLNNAENILSGDKLPSDVSVSSMLETAYLEVSEVIEYLKKIKVEK